MDALDPDKDLLDEVEEKSGKRALCIFAHPDDLEFTCGGTVAMMSSKGWTIDILVTTSGNKGTKDPTVTAQQLAGEREEETRAAATIMGANEPRFLGFPDGMLSSDDRLRELLVLEIRKLRPELVITWDGFRSGFNHRDHRVTGISSYDAIYPAADDHLFHPNQKLQGLKPFRPSAMLLAGTDVPDYHVDIKDHMETKIAALLAHVSQMGGRDAKSLRKMFADRLAANEKNDVADSLPPLRESFKKVILRR